MTWPITNNPTWVHGFGETVIGADNLTSPSASLACRSWTGCPCGCGRSARGQPKNSSPSKKQLMLRLSVLTLIPKWSTCRRFDQTNADIRTDPSQEIKDPARAVRLLIRMSLGKYDAAD